MAAYTRQLVKQNGYEEVVVVLQGRAEEIELPEQVDVLVSEWMGNCLLVIMSLPTLLLLIRYSMKTFAFWIGYVSSITALCCKYV